MHFIKKYKMSSLNYLITSYFGVLFNILYVYNQRFWLHLKSWVLFFSPLGSLQCILRFTAKYACDSAFICGPKVLEGSVIRCGVALALLACYHAFRRCVSWCMCCGRGIRPVYTVWALNNGCVLAIYLFVSSSDVQLSDQPQRDTRMPARLSERHPCSVTS